MGKSGVLVASAASLNSVELALRSYGIEVLRCGLEISDALLTSPLPLIGIVACDGPEPHAAIDTIRRIRRASPRIRIFVVADPGSEAVAIAAIRAGVTDYFKAPIDAAAVASSVARALPAGEAGGSRNLAAMIGESRAVQEIRQWIARVAPGNTSVLVTGETGTGKEMVAQLMHQLSDRAERSFVCINCAAIPDTLLESELFGWERGAFTGAGQARAGYFSAANGGTVLLDEIGEMTPYAQAKILRALDCREIYRLGATRSIPLDIRVIAATNQNLERLIEEGKFRRDLYYRLRVSHISLPPLRERREDIPLLLAHYLREMNLRHHRYAKGFTAAALEQMTEYDWPGNVREVRNVLESVFAELPAREIEYLEAPEWLRRHVMSSCEAGHDERTRLLAALASTDWNVSKAAQQLQWCRMTLYRKMAKYHVSRTPQDVVA
jgi:DNA-binding NtrC family response regulator